MLEKVAFSSKMTASARAVYLALHVLARDVGVVEMAQSDLALKMGLSEREVRRRLAELREGKFVRLMRGKIYLGWVHEPAMNVLQEHEEPAMNVLMKRPYMSASDPCIKSLGIQVLQDERTFTRCGCGTPHDGTEPRKCRCGRAHYPENATSEDALSVVVEMLHGFVQRAGLSWGEPDGEIAAAVLESAGGVEALWLRLGELAAGRQKPTKSYAWFVAVVGRRRMAIA